MQQWILDWIGAFGGLAIWWLIFLENLFPPIPSEVILTFSGFLTVQSGLTLSTAAVAATIGSVTGALALYAVGHALGQQRLMRWLDGRAGRILRLSSADVEKAQRWFDRHGGGAVFFCRFVPLVRSLISIPAGIAHMPLLRFTLLTTIGFRPVVFDDRPELANTRLFPTAEQVICGDFTRISDYLTITDEDFVVIMTSGHVRDFQVEEQTLRGDFAYVGVIGSRRKTASVNQRLLEAGIPQSSIDLVHTPIGTPILAVTPEEIAVSIAGEMIQVRAQRRGPTSHGCPMHG